VSWCDAGSWHNNLQRNRYLERQARRYLPVDGNAHLSLAHEIYRPHYEMLYVHRLPVTQRIATIRRKMSRSSPNILFLMSDEHSREATDTFMIRRHYWKYVEYPGYPSELFNLAPAVKPDHCGAVCIVYKHLCSSPLPLLRATRKFVFESNFIIVRNPFVTMT